MCQLPSSNDIHAPSRNIPDPYAYNGSETSPELVSGCCLVTLCHMTYFFHMHHPLRHAFLTFICHSLFTQSRLPFVYKPTSFQSGSSLLEYNLQTALLYFSS